MTNESINKALLKHRGYTQYKGNKDNLSPIMYFFLMDASKTFFPDVKKQKCSGMQKKLMRQMEEGYHLFFKNFFSAFDVEQTDYLMDKVDAFEEYIQHHLDIAEIAVQECDNSRPIEEQRECSRVWLCNILAADAQDFHGECWRTGSNQPLYDRYIDQVLKSSKEYSRLRFGEGPVLTEKQFKRVQLSVKVLARKVCDFVYQDYQQEIAKKNGNNTDSAALQGHGGESPAGDAGADGHGRVQPVKGAGVRGASGDGRPGAGVGGNVHDSGGRPAGQEPRNNLALQRPYGGFPVIPRVRRGTGAVD
mgnify:CR=1 FL=1